ncbi:hypothetical protein O0L34_g11857 [Tuta absoluta]|nr:hypothetical protein O0L34_g11857 [Tuta absoluta]
MMLLWALDDVHSAVYKSDDYYKGLFDGTGQFVPWDDYYHYPNQILNWPEKQNPKPLDPYINGTSTRVPLPTYTPDWRAPEPPYIAKNEYFKEEGRYYRIQSSNIYNWNNYRSWESPGKMMCYCVTVYKKYTPLAMGAVLTYRNMLTTALSTDMVVSKYRNRKTLHNILGAWYNSDSYGMKDVTNSVYYLTPARIHYHPKWNPPEMVNRSHPIPSVYDLALWTTTKSMYYDRAFIKRAEAGFADAQHRGYRTMLCDRWSNIQGRSLMPDYGTDLVFIVGCQMIMDIGRFPYPWFKYAMRFHGGNGKLNPCPKVTLV